MMRSLVPVLGILALAVPTPGQGSDDPVVLCDSCVNRGERDCSRHRRTLELERAVAFCSEAARCKRCRGALTTDCKVCTNPGAEADAERRRELAREWIEARKRIVADFTRGEGDEIMHLKTEHLDLAFDAWPLKVGRTKLDNHAAMHLYATRIEALRESFIETFELRSRDFPREGEDISPRMVIWIVRDPAEQRLIAPRATGGTGQSVKLMGSKLAYTVLHDRKLFRNDDALHRNVAHAVGHLLLSNLQPSRWVGNQKHGWIDEGVAHYFEYRVDRRCSNFCYEEVGMSPGANFKGGYWRVAVRKLVEAGKLRPFVEYYQKNSDQLDFQEHAQAFAAVEFLIAVHGGKRFAEMVRMLKRGGATRDAMQKNLGFGPLGFDERFSAWVRETYPRTRR